MQNIYPCIITYSFYQISMEDAKEVHSSLRRAAGLFKFVQVELEMSGIFTSNINQACQNDVLSKVSF